MTSEVRDPLAEHLVVRRFRFEYPEDLDPAWSPRLPEFAAAANSVSMIMPFAEPYFVQTTRAALADLDPDLAARAEAYARQEAQHHAQHHRFNRLIVARYPRLARLERWLRIYPWLGRTRSLRFNLAFAAASEPIAYLLARWVEPRIDRLFRGADPVASSLFLWHLGEEVEHKSVAYDVWAAVDGRRWRYAWALACSLTMLGLFTWLGTLSQLRAQGRLFNPLSHIRLAGWAISVAFTILPTLAVSATAGHHPSRLADPPTIGSWLRGYDPESQTMPVWPLSTFDDT